MSSNAAAAARLPATKSGSSKAIESAVTALFSALRDGNYSSACNQYTPAIRNVLIAAAAKLYGRSYSGCAASLSAIYNATPAIAAQFRHLGAPHYVDLSIHGSTATVVYISTVGNLVAHSDITVERESGRWLVGQATSLTFSRR
jgi:hypothetical protein